MYPIPVARTRILLIDDHPLVRTGYRHLLHCTHQLSVVAEASTAAAGYRRYLRGGIDLTILDLSLPGAGGLDLLRRMRYHDEDARVLVVSMYDEPTMVERALNAGALGYLCKRSNPELLTEAAIAVAGGQRVVDPSLTVYATPQAGDGAKSTLKSLSEREFEIFRQLAEGRSVDFIATSLNLSYKTVANYGSMIRNKLGIGNRAEMARFAISAGIVVPP